jgi:glyoxylase-like metal-dependent hydrolase (beta-lactamase superfamily II)
MRKIDMAMMLILAFVLSVEPIRGQSPTLQSYERAREVLDKSVAAYGGLENLRGIENFSLRADGVEFHRNQSRRPDLAESTPRRYEVTIDLKNNRYRLFAERYGIGTDSVPSYDVFDGKERISANLLTKTKAVRPVQNNWRQQYTALFLPQFLALNALDRPANLRYLGRADFQGRPHDVISFHSPDGTRISLYIDDATRLIAKQESLVHDALTGDALTETIFSAYRQLGKFKVPTEAAGKIAGVTTYKLNYSDISFDTNLPESVFRLEFDLNSPLPEAPSEAPVNRLGENIYTVTVAGYRVLFAGFKDYIFVMEAPVGEVAAREAIARIKETIPGKPIKYIAVTHFHADHAGSTRTFIAEGATLVTTLGNRGYFEQMMKSRFTLASDSLSVNPQPLRIEMLETEKRVFSDGTTTVAIYNTGANPHADDMLIAYLPKEKILYEADIFDSVSDNRYPATRHLLKWLEKTKLAVEKIIPVHGTPAAFSEVIAVVAEREKTRN